VNIGFLVKYTAEQGEPHRYGSVRQDEVLTLRLQWEEGVPLEDAVTWLGATKFLMLDLVKIGLLTLDETVDLNRIELLTFSKEDLDRCYCQLTRGVRSPWSNRGPLAKTARALSVFGLKVADVFKLVADGKLHIWAPTDSPSVAQLTFDPEEVAALIKGPDLGRSLLDSEEAAQRLGVAPWTVFDWTATGYISAVLSYDFDKYFDPDELDEFMADYITSCEAIKIWGVEVEEVKTWCWDSDWGIKSVKGTSIDGRPLHLFRRGDVERLRTEFSASDGLNSHNVLQSH